MCGEGKYFRRMSYSVQSFVGNSGFIKEIRKIILSICNNTVTVLITGEKGTGKNLFSKVVHMEGGKNPADYLELNCKLYAKKADVFFEAIQNFASGEESNQSAGKTVYISNIDKLSIENQDNLVAVMKDIRLQKRKFRFIFSSENAVEEMMEKDLFSKDLYFQISTILVNMLPLRQHKEDIPEIADYYFKMFNRLSSSEFKGFSEAAKGDIMNHFWVGNVAELKNAIERCFIIGQPPYIKTNDLALKMSNKTEEIVDNTLEDQLDDKSLKFALDSFKKSYVTKILEENNWNQTKAAKVLGIQRTYVIRLINELQIRK